MSRSSSLRPQQEEKTSGNSERSTSPPLVMAVQTLRKLGVGPEHQGALQMDKDGVRELVPCLFWVTRCMPAIAYIHVADREGRIALQITKYGSLRTRVLDPSAQETLMRAAEKAGFEEIFMGDEGERFSEDGSIEGRTVEP